MSYYGDRTYARFYALETIARVPYFSYLCVLHLYETLGQWRQVRATGEKQQYVLLALMEMGWGELGAEDCRERRRGITMQNGRVV